MSTQARSRQLPDNLSWRFYGVAAMLILLFGALLVRTAYIQLISPDRLVAEGDSRTLRTMTAAMTRGIITDRNGEELAVSVPVQAIWADPKTVYERHGLDDERRWQALADVLGVDPVALRQRVAANPNKRFVYLARQVSPAAARFTKELAIPGVYLKEESRRFYPTGEVSAQLIGFTNIDDAGQEGIERAYNSWLTGKAGRRLVRKDASGRVVESMEELEASTPPQNIALTIDQRIQTLAYQELKYAVEYHQAAAASLVVIDIPTGEVLAMVNTPSFNPNNRGDLASHRTRNRAITDTFEPGSTIKPLAVAAGLAAGTITPQTIFDTNPGWLRVGGRVVRDHRNYGVLDTAGVIAKSSNIGTTKIALGMPLDHYLSTLRSFGFGTETGIGLTGEVPGMLSSRRRWSEFEIATLSFGYGITVTPLQLAQAYATLGGQGVYRPPTIIKGQERDAATQVLEPRMASQVVQMMEAVTNKGGTGTAAQVPGYRVAGKTGTARKAVAGGYGSDYIATFVGVAPVSNPRLAIAVVMDEPGGDQYYGGEVSAPVFGKVMSGALRILNVEPDGVTLQQGQVAALTVEDKRG